MKAGLSNEPYLIINIVFAGVILLVMIYSGIFSPDKSDHPIACFHEKVTGQQCVSCGLSHSFSLIVRGRIDEAGEWNRNGMRVFLFFFSQLLLRGAFSFWYLNNPETARQTIILDITGSFILFMIAFWPFILFIFRGI